MSTGVLAAVRNDTQLNVSDTPKDDIVVSVDFGRGDSEDPVWPQVDDILMATLGQTNIHKLEAPVPNMQLLRVAIAPGISVKIDEYAERYGAIDLEQLKQRMPPNLYTSFVRYIGSIPGDRTLDVNQITTVPE